MKAKLWRVIAAGCIVALGVGFIVAMYAIGLTAKDAAERDYIEYWAAGHELVRGANPYDPEAILRLERSLGREENFPQITFSPPVMLVLAWPLGHLSAKTGLILWLLASLGCIAAAIGLVWLVHGKPDSRMQVIGFAFPPALACLMAGQLGDFFLLETALFLYLEKSRPWLAGAAMVLFVLKPHLFGPCFLALLLWSVWRRDFRILAGFLAALAVCCAVVAGLDQQAWRQYSDMIRSTRITDLYIPTMAMDLRYLIDGQAKWLEYVPEVLACLWAGWYFWTRRERWNWVDHGLLLFLVSVACAPYGWYYDQSLLLPAIIAGLYRAERSKSPLILFALIMTAGMVAILANVQPTSGFYAWTAPAWLVWYIYATRSYRRSDTAAPQTAVLAG